MLRPHGSNFKARAVVVAILCHSAIAATILGADSDANDTAATRLSVNGSRFAVNDRPVFLVGVSYYGALGAPEDFMRRDIADLNERGFNWLRVWATWEAHGEDVSAVDSQGRPREPYLRKLRWLVAECDRQGWIVDVTLTRGKSSPNSRLQGRLRDLEAHRRAVTEIVRALQPYRNWYLDLANERDVGDDRFVPIEELKTLRELARELDPALLVTASFGGHDLSRGDVTDSLIRSGQDFLAVHRPRHPSTAKETRDRTREVLQFVKAAGRTAPVHHQEPFRRGYAGWEPDAGDFVADLRGAIQGGAAGWCFHNGSQRTTRDHRPRRSFGMSKTRLMDQLDEQERQFVDGLRAVLEGADADVK